MNKPTFISVYVMLLALPAAVANFPCICNYDEEIPVLARPEHGAPTLDHMYEFDCKPAFTAYTGDDYSAVQIGGKIVYVSITQQIQHQTCGGAPSVADLVPSTTGFPSTTKQMLTAISTTESTTQMFSSDLTTQMPKADSTSHMLPSTESITQMPTTVFTTQNPTTVPITQMPQTESTTEMSTNNYTTQKTTTESTTQRPTTVFTAQILTTVQTDSTTQMSTTFPTTQKPTIISTTQIPTTDSTSRMPSTKSTAQVPTTNSTTQIPTTDSTSQMRTTNTSNQTIPITQYSTSHKVFTTRMPITVSTTLSIAPTTLYHKSNVTNSVLRYIGVSYNLTNGNPVRGTTTPSMTDPGLLLGNRVFQLTEYQNGTSREVELTNMPGACTTEYGLIHNGKSYQEELSAHVSPTADHPQQLLDSAFVFNQEFNDVRSYMETPHNTDVYQDQLTLCSRRKLRLKVETSDWEPISITRDFAKDVCDLPGSYDFNRYMNFLDKWGTSIVTEVVLGTKKLTRYKTTVADIFGTVDQKNTSLFHHAGYYTGYASSLTLTRKDYVNNVARTANIGTSATTYRSHAGETVPVALKLVPLTKAFDWKFWKHVNGEFIETGTCQDDLTMASIQQRAGNIQKTLQLYFSVKNALGPNLPTLTDSDLQIPVTWPKGTYGLMKAKTGCPMGNVIWREGWRVQDSLHVNLHTQFSAGISNTLSGEFGARIQTRYCMKTSDTFSPYDRDWPRGSYCLLKKGACPSGFVPGSLYWDDKDVLNRNDYGGTMPDGTYDGNTSIFYCCRNDGPSSNPITLPVDHSFVLIRFKGPCQKVYDMSMREAFIEWDTSDVLNKDVAIGAHPLDDGGEGHRLHFCFYHFNTGGLIIG